MIKFSFLLLLFVSAHLSAQLMLPDIFSDNMVFQQKQEIPIWGSASPNEKITIRFNKHVCSTKADKQGKWVARLTAMKYGGPYVMNIQTKNNSIRFSNILIGEVWLCSGQSNMEMPLEGWPNGDGTYRYPINHSEQEIADAQYPKIRLLQLEPAFSLKEQSNLKLVGNSWRECSPKTVRTFSATAYFFAREVYRKTGIPIGIIESSVGGTTAELWTSRKALKTMDDFKNKVTELESSSDSNKHQYSIGSLFNGMIAPLIPYGIRGVLWYQGEFSTGRAYQYKELFPKMIVDWRSHWKQGNFPFYYVQLPVAGFPDTINLQSTWAELREAQLQTLSVPNTAMAVTIDFTDNDLHPANKQDFGYRLALIALHKIYEKKNAYCGPLYKSYTIEGNAVRISFSNPEVGLKSRNGGSLSGFYIAGEDKKFCRGNAHIEDNTIVVTSENVTHPLSVRYAWCDYPNGNLFYSKDLIPASPFRTDDWEMTTRYNK